MGLRQPLLKWGPYTSYLPTVRVVQCGRWSLKVQPDANGDWQWEAEDWNKTYGFHHVIGTSRTIDEAMNSAVRWARTRR